MDGYLVQLPTAAKVVNSDMYHSSDSCMYHHSSILKHTFSQCLKRFTHEKIEKRSHLILKESTVLFLWVVLSEFAPRKSMKIFQ